jgi:hypothetical protein
MNAELEHSSDVLVPQCGGRARFAQKTFASLFAPAGDRAPDDFQRNLTVKRGIEGTICCSHCTATEFVRASIFAPIDLVASDILVALERGGD